MAMNVAGAAITGMGAICPIGKDIASILDSLRAPRGGFGEIIAFDTNGLKVRCAAEVRDYDPSAHFAPEECERLDRTAQFAIIATREAVAAAGLGREEFSSGRVALVMGICAGGVGDLTLVKNLRVSDYFGNAPDFVPLTDAVLRSDRTGAPGQAFGHVVVRASHLLAVGEPVEDRALDPVGVGAEGTVD